ncbi:MAG: ATP-dependent Clp protease proteolytic subunit [Gemmatimonadetes bacterium]|jgi:membrane-bound serine protease (ClpP class)|nr:ATP-dependent Clp protease proteolytic subunit [Gemmatimonadota bacterium]
MNRRQRVCLLASAVVLGPLALPVPAQNRHTVYRVPVTGVIELGLAPYIERSVSEAAAAGASAIVLDIDTPGGRVDAAERIADALSDSEVPVYSLVNRRAFSAGALIALSTSRIYMRPGSVIGAATPVDGSGKKAPEKIVSAMRSEMRALAEAQGLDPTVAAAMVDEDVEIEGVVESGKLLTLTTSEAVALDYAVEIEDLDALLAALGYSGADVVTSKVNWAEQLVRFFSNPIVAPFLLSLGFLGLLAEIKTPSFGMAGLAGVISLSLYFGSHLIVGLAGLEDMLIFGAGVVLLGVEALVIPGFGLFGVAGIAAVAAGLFMSMLGSLPTASEYTSAGMILTTTVLLVLVSAWALIRTLPKTSRLAKSGIFLLQRTDRAIGYESAEVRDDLMDSVGTAITDLRPSGTALFGDERIDVVSESEWITEGTQVRVISAEGYRHIVRAVSADEAENV